MGPMTGRKGILKPSVCQMGNGEESGVKVKTIERVALKRNYLPTIPQPLVGGGIPGLRRINTRINLVEIFL